MMGVREAALAQSSERRTLLRDRVRSGEDEIGRVLGLCGGVNQKFAIVAKFPE